MIEITLEQPDDAAPIEHLLDLAFGTDRLRKQSYTYRRGVERLASLCLVARCSARLAGTIRVWPVGVGLDAAPAILVGPVAVDPEFRGHGVGRRLIADALARAATGGYGLALLVGDVAYYGRFGFAAAERWRIGMAEENPARVLALPLDPARPVPAGVLRPWKEPPDSVDQCAGVMTPRASSTSACAAGTGREKK